jgi:hypothetical protein
VWAADTQFGGQLEATILVSPAQKPGGGFDRYAEDANRGPIPLECRLVKRHGDKTLEIDYAIRTDLNECHLFTQSPPSIISHLWTMAHDIDQDHYTTRHVQGQAVFRADRLLDRGNVPDDFRSTLFHAVPENMRRFNIKVQTTEDGTRCVYSFVDKEMPLNIDSGIAQEQGVTRIEAFWKVGYHKISVDMMLLTGVAIAFGSGGVGPDFLMNAVPHIRKSLVVRVWGSRISRRGDLYAFGMRIVGHLLPLGSAFGVSMDHDVTEDVAGKFVEINTSAVSGPVQSIIDIVRTGSAGTAALGVMNLEAMMVGGGPGKDDDIPGVFTSKPAVNPAPPNDSGTRGTFVRKIVSQILAEPCHRFTRPPEPGVYVIASE